MPAYDKSSEAGKASYPKKMYTYSKEVTSTGPSVPYMKVNRPAAFHCVKHKTDAF